MGPFTILVLWIVQQQNITINFFFKFQIMVENLLPRIYEALYDSMHYF